MMSPISVRVCDEVHGVEKVYQLQQPYAILGPGTDMDVTLPTVANIKPRRFYLQAVDAGVVAVELGGRRSTDPAPAAARLIRSGEALRIGPYAVIAERNHPHGSSNASRAIAVRSSKFDNEPTQDTWLYFVNGHSRATGKSVRHLRQTLTLIGRSKSCHLKLSHPCISRYQCSVVRNGDEFWTVALSRRNDLRVNGRRVTSSRLTVGDILSVGPFRMQLQQGILPGSAPHRQSSDHPNGETDRPSGSPHRAGTDRKGTRRECDLLSGDSGEWDTVGCSSDSDIVSLIQQFATVQQLLMAQSQQQASMLLHLIRSIQLDQENQRELLKEQIAAIQAISDELHAWRAESERKAVTIPPLRLESQLPPHLPSSDVPVMDANVQDAQTPRVPRTAEEIQAHASLSERINCLERERKSILQKILRLLPGKLETDG